MNWGTGLAITLGIFIIGMGSVLYLALQQRHDLVTTDYYQQELAYQSTIDGKRNASALNADCKLEKEDQALFLRLPEDLQGQKGKMELTMYFPTQAELDFKLAEEEWTAADIELPADKIAPGKWIAKLRFTTADKVYYFEPQIVL